MKKIVLVLIVCALLSLAIVGVLNSPIMSDSSELDKSTQSSEYDSELEESFEESFYEESDDVTIGELI